MKIAKAILALFIFPLLLLGAFGALETKAFADDKYDIKTDGSVTFLTAEQIKKLNGFLDLRGFDAVMKPAVVQKMNLSTGKVRKLDMTDHTTGKSHYYTPLKVDGGYLFTLRIDKTRWIYRVDANFKLITSAIFVNDVPADAPIADPEKGLHDEFAYWAFIDSL